MGRLSKHQDPAHFKTRPISSYFFLASRSATNQPPSPPRILGPSSQQSQPTPDEEPVNNGSTSNRSSSNSSNASAFISSTTAAVNHTTDSYLDDPSDDPFNDSYNSHDESNGWETAKEEQEEVESPTASTRASSDNSTRSDTTSTAEKARTEKVLNVIDSMELVGSQTSSESLRRLAVSPRKPKRALDLGLLGSPGSKPVLIFSEKLAAEMSRAAPGDKNTFGGYNNNSSPLKPKKLKFEALTQKSIAKEDIEVQGSDSGSDADWDDKDSYVSAVVTSRRIPQETAPSVVNLSDDEIPTLSKFTSKRGAIELDDSDSDFGEDPFASKNLAPVVSAPPAAGSLPVGSTIAIVLPARAPKDDVFDSDIDLSEGTDSNSDERSDRVNRRRTRADTGSAAGSRPAEAMSRYGRTLRSTNPQPELDLDMPVPRAPKYNKPAKKSPFSLDSLLKEKERRERVGYDLQAVKNHIALEDEELEELDMNDEDLQAIPEGVLSEQQEADLKEIIKDAHTQTVEDIAEFFIYWPQNLVVDPLEMHLTEADSVDHIVQRVLKHTRTERTSLLGVDHQDLVRIFRIYGAKEEYLEEKWQVTPVTSDTKAERAIDSDTPKFPRQNLRAVLKLINLTATLDPQFYDNTEIRKITGLLLRMTTDPIIGDIKSLLGSTLAALLDAVPIHSWDTEEILKSLGTSAAFLLLTLHQLPSLSGRITLLRRSIALAYMNQPPIPAGQVAPDINELHRALFVDRELQALRNSDYAALGRRYQIYGFCMDDEQILAGYGRRDVELVSKKLQIIHGRISDAKAAHLDRTRTKEYIQRIIVRLEMVILQKESAQSTLKFAGQNNASNNNSSNTSSNSNSY
ncbi:hypothetical protein EC991_008978 [Linnemannia zychae]|nr:hypothetical protein EC991_008978 [Linnemannia zychae]